MFPNTRIGRCEIGYILSVYMRYAIIEMVYRVMFWSAREIASKYFQDCSRRRYDRFILYLYNDLLGR